MKTLLSAGEDHLYTYNSYTYNSHTRKKEGTMIAEEQQKSMKLLAYWLFSMVVMVFGAITAFIALWVRPVGASMWTVIKSGFPIWGITGLAAVIIFAGYYFYTGRKAKAEAE